MKLGLDRIASPLGALLLVTDGRALRALDYEDCAEHMRRLLRLHYDEDRLEERAAPTFVKRALRDYFAGELGALASLPVATRGTPFQRRVWAALRRIPPGTTTSYGRLAERVGVPGGARAVGMANHSNPVAIVVPCHRVIGIHGTLTGYAGGVERKRWLLEHERSFAAEGAARSAAERPRSGATAPL